MSLDATMQSLRQRLSLMTTWVANELSGLRVLAWTAAFFCCWLYLTSFVSTPFWEKAQGNVFFEPRNITREGFVRTLPSDIPKRFFFVVAGSSETSGMAPLHYQPNGNLAMSLVNLLPGDMTPAPLVRDTSNKGSFANSILIQAESAMPLKPDLIVMNFSLANLPDLFNAPPPLTAIVQRMRLRTTASAEGASDGQTYRAAVLQFASVASSPSDHLNTTLAEHFPSYQNRFADSLLPVFFPGRIVREETDRAARAGVKKVLSILADTATQDLLKIIDRQMDERTISFTIFEEIAQICHDSGIRVVFVIPPIDSSQLNSAELDTLHRVQRLFESEMRRSPHVNYLPLLVGDTAYATEFHNSLHPENYEPLARSVYEYLVARSLLPELTDAGDEP